MTGARRPRVHFLDDLRGLAILIVVANHVNDVVPLSSALGPIPDVLFRHINIVFIFVSGYLFQYLSGGFEYGSFLARKFRNVVTPYLIVSIPAVAIYLTGLKPVKDGIGDPSDPLLAVKLLLTGTHLGPLWFIPMIMSVFLISPLLIRLDRARAYLLILPALGLALAVGRPENNANPLQAAVFFLPVFLVGMMFARYREAVDPALRRDDVFAALLGAFIGFTIAVAYCGVPLATPLIDDAIYVSKFALVALCYAACMRWYAYLPRWTAPVGLASFGVFFLHGYFVAAAKMAVDHFKLAEAHPAHALVLYAMIYVAVLVASFQATNLVRLVAGARSRIVIGV